MSGDYVSHRASDGTPRHNLRFSGSSLGRRIEAVSPPARPRTAAASPLYADAHTASPTARRLLPRRAQRSEDGGSDDEAPAQQQAPQVKVFIQQDDDRGGSNREVDRGRSDSVTMSRQDLEEMIVWETNNLYEYLKGLYAQGLEEAQAGHEFDKEAWEQRMAHLWRLLQQRDSEVEELQRMLGEREEQLGEREDHIRQQAQLIRSQAAQIRDLLRQAEQWRDGIGSRRGDEANTDDAEDSSIAALPHKAALPQKTAALPQKVVFSEAHVLQLPPQQVEYQSYKDYESCGLWEAISDSWLLHRKRLVLGGIAVALLLLLIILLATLIPRKGGSEGITFLQAPAVAATGASFFDLSVQLDQPALVSYMLFKYSDLGQQVAGTGKTLLDLIQSEEVCGEAIFDASAPSTSLQPAGVQPGLQQLAAACGWAPVPNANQNQRVSLGSVASAQSAACTATDAPRKCARCPRIAEGTSYTILLVASTPSGESISRVQVLSAVSQSSAVNINSINPPFASNITSRSFELNVKLNVPGTVHYAVVYDSVSAEYGQYSLIYESLPPSSTAVLSADPENFVGGVVATGSFSVPAANEWAVAEVQPPCVASLCQQSIHGLLGGTTYRVYLAAEDLFGNVDPAPLMVRLTTDPDTSAPALLPPSGPIAITASSFGFNLTMDTAGAAYYMVLAAKPSSRVAEPEVAHGSWATLRALPTSSNRRRQLLSSAGRNGDSSSSSSIEAAQQEGQFDAWGPSSSAGAAVSVAGSSRGLLEADAADPDPGSLVSPTCYPANLTCSAAPASVFAGVSGLAAFDVLSSGCAPAPTAGQRSSLPTSSGLQNNTLYYVLVATEDSSVPTRNVQRAPSIFAVRTVDLSAPKFACGFPAVTNISSSGLVVSVQLTKPAWAFYVALPTSQAGTTPSAMDILQGQGAGGQGVAAAGNMTRSGFLPWEAAGGRGDARKLWASVPGLQAGVSYTVFVTLTLDGNNPLPSNPVARVSDVYTPATAPPTFSALKAISTTVDEATGTFALGLNATLDRAGVVFYAVYRAYSCITGEPSVGDILSGGPLPASICTCSEAWYCSLVTAGNFTVPASGQPASGTISGGLAPLPFESLRNAPESQLRCFRGGLGQATDTYNIYLVAGSALPTYTGLAPQCSSVAQAAASAAALAAGEPGDSCPSSPSLACGQAQARPDVRIMQSAALVAWEQAGSSGGETEWQPPAGMNVYSRPAKVQLSLEGGEPPAFTFGPDFPATGQLTDGLFMQFKLNKPALVIYAVRSFPVFDPATNDFPPPVLVSTGRVPVFEANTTYNATIRACNGEGWPAGPLRSNAQYSVQYVARDKYGRMDGPCPPSTPSCLATTTTLA